MQVAVFCAASNKVSKTYLNVAAQLGTFLAKNNIHTIYGGGADGLMGELSNAILKENGPITGIIPQFMLNKGWANTQVKNMKVVADMRTRKAAYLPNTHAIIALPGGIGTLEELLEVMTLKQLGEWDKPIYILNTNNFFNPFLELINGLNKEHFLRQTPEQLFTLIATPKQLMDELLAQ